MLGIDPSLHERAQGLLRILVDDIEDLEGPSIVGAIRHEIV